MTRDGVVWWLFLASAVCFVIVAVRQRDLISGLGGLLFFLACVVHLTGTRR